MRSISTSISTFSKLIESNCLYVDKTEYIYRMVKAPFGQYFYSRPRRFGKSLTVSTLEAVFAGQKNLFEGLWIYESDYEWAKYPIIHIDFGRSDSTSKENLEKWIGKELAGIAKSNGVEISGDSPALMFGELIKALYNKESKGVVILIDEYDRPVTNNIEDGRRVDEIRIMMEAFYQMIKGYESMLRFVFLTGITRLSQVSIFSKLNNLEDISRRTEYSSMVGYTDEELDRYFDDYIREGASKLNCTENELKASLTKWYDGFRFAPNGKSVYNPVSIGQFFNNGCEFGNYWYATATPVMLVNQAKKQKLTIEDIENAVFTDVSYNSFDLMSLAGDELNTQMLVQLLFQTGYLTFGDRIQGTINPAYKLVYPNYEVRQSFEMELTSIYAGQGVQEINSMVTLVQQAAGVGDVDRMMSVLKSMFASVPYDLHLKYEKYYQSLLFLTFKMCGMDVVAEDRTNIGRIDAVLRSGEYIYVIECKLDKSAEKAIEQIEAKKYAEKFEIDKELCKKIIWIGMNFSYDDNIRNIESYRVEDISMSSR